jgi:uncharacterized membrane protein YeaQ/YmgE (transglycosylase-associated protein family)
MFGISVIIPGPLSAYEVGREYILFTTDAKSVSEEPDIMIPDGVSVIVWLVAGAVGGNAAGELLNGDYDLGPGNTFAGAIGGVVGGLILQTLIPSLRGFDYGSIVGQLIGAAASGAFLMVIAAAVKTRRGQKR